MKIFRIHKPYISKDGYKQVYRPKNPMARYNGYVPEHRLIASKKMGRPLLSNEIVHHIDGNKRNNRPGNLAIVTKREHWFIHFRNKRK